MGTVIKNQPWEVHGASVRGVSHARANLPNQDAWTCSEGDSIVLAVADGHGSAKSFRSDMGAKFAVKVAKEALREFADEVAIQGNLDVVERRMESEVPRSIVERWRGMVKEHITANPLTETELGRIHSGDGKHVQELSLVTYGATLIAVILTDRFVGYLQLGDGDILVVSENGDVSRPMPPDERLMANETTSLCSTTAWADFRIKLAQTTTLPVLILASTDGYSNSFCSDADFLRVGSDLLEILRTNGLEYVKAHLENWLAESSKAGSGDDVTVGVLYRMATAGDKSPDVSSAMQSSSEPKPSL